MLWRWKPLKWLGKRCCWGNVGQNVGDASVNLREDELEEQPDMKSGKPVQQLQIKRFG